MVSVKDVAAAAQVSVGTVSNVLNRPDRVAAATVERVRRAIDELGFVRNDAARQLRAGRSRSLGLIVHDLANPFFAAIARSAEARAAEEGLSLLVAGSDGDAEREARYLSLFAEQRASGVLVAPIGGEDAILEHLEHSGIPAVLVDRDAENDTLSSVSVDDVEGGRLAVARLIEQGRRRIAFAGGPEAVHQVRDRHAGAQAAVAASGATLERLPSPTLTVEDGRRIGDELLARPAAERPDGVFAANDLVALGLIQSLVMSGSVRMPQDMALVGYDDIDFAPAAVVPLTSVRQPAADIGASAVELLLGGEPRHVRFVPELVLRESA